MKYDRESGSMQIAVTELASFAYARENPQALLEKYKFTKKIVTPENDSFDYPSESSYSPAREGEAMHNVYEADAVIGLEQTTTEVPLEKNTAVGGIKVNVRGFADIISYDGIYHTVEEIKTVRYLDRGITPFNDPSHFAQAAIYACILAENEGLSQIRIALSYIRRSGGDKLTYTAIFTRVALIKMLDSLLERAAGFIKTEAERYTVLPHEISKMPFPYKSIRSGQERFIKEAYRAITQGSSLLVSAPTGIGKTISSVFPAVKAVGADKLDRFFYFTAKTITGAAALEAVRELSHRAPHLRAVMIQSKEQLCPYQTADSSLRMKCRFCERVNGITESLGKNEVSYRERELQAMSALLTSSDTVYTSQRIKKTAEEFTVCPYELSLDLSEYCIMIVCDYNYVIDDKIRFKRYFKDIKRAGEKYAFLFDEAHNLPDRARNTYSSSVSSADAAGLSELCGKYFPEDAQFKSAADALSDALSEISAMCTESEYTRMSDEGEISCGFYESSRIPDRLISATDLLSGVIYKYIRDGEDPSEVLPKYYDIISKISFTARYFDRGFRFFSSREGKTVKAEILCLDPSGVLEAMLSPAASSVLFSATLSPTEYFAEVTGMRSASVLELESPYEKENLCLIAYDSISTRLQDRKFTAGDCAQVISEAVSAKAGNYIVYFPSYDYMKRVCGMFAREMPECAVVMQKQGMSYRERERFIGVFREYAGSGKSIVGFCVLGGMFSEGIDLSGESLIGAIIIGTGMPQLSAKRNIMAAYYDEKLERGYDFAYTCPGMNKVLQAAGRVIRSENDRGAVIIIDDRMNEPSMKALFPAHWRHMKYTGDLMSLRSVLDKFWK